MAAFRSIRLWYLVFFLFALPVTGCGTSGREKVVEHPILRLYGAEDPQFSRKMGTLLGTGILDGNRVEVLLNSDEIFPAMLYAIRSAKTTIMFETFIYWSGSIGSEFTNALAELARAGWGALLEAGVEIHEYQPTMYHCKVMIVDGLWTTLGSTNFDPRSFSLNDEANVNFYDVDFARRQIGISQEDLAHSRQITFQE